MLGRLRRNPRITCSLKLASASRRGGCELNGVTDSSESVIRQHCLMLQERLEMRGAGANGVYAPEAVDKTLDYLPAPVCAASRTARFRRRRGDRAPTGG